MAFKRFYFHVDVESTGLNFMAGEAVENELLQISYIITNPELDILLERDLVIKADEEALNMLSNDARQMHEDTGLLDRCTSDEAITLDEALQIILRDIQPYTGTWTHLIPVGNNVQFDIELIRRHLRQVYTNLHWSCIDVSSVRNFISLKNPEFSRSVYANKLSNHDALVDIRECLNELKIYQSLLIFNK